MNEIFVLDSDGGATTLFASSEKLKKNLGIIHKLEVGFMNYNIG